MWIPPVHVECVAMPLMLSLRGVPTPKTQNRLSCRQCKAACAAIYSVAARLAGNARPGRAVK
jgi:hypothetical protein